VPIQGNRPFARPRRSAYRRARAAALELPAIPRAALMRSTRGAAWGRIPSGGGLHLGDRLRDRRRRRQQDSDLDALERLTALHERGVISDEDFAERKAELGAGT
jgi:hypothetical protein